MRDVRFADVDDGRSVLYGGPHELAFLGDDTGVKLCAKQLDTESDVKYLTYLFYYL